jgi:hypothetical protein
MDFQGLAALLASLAALVHALNQTLPLLSDRVAKRVIRMRKAKHQGR